MLCLSSNFVTDPHCVSMFHYINNMHKDLQIVVFGEDNKWLKSNIGMQVSHAVSIHFALSYAVILVVSFSQKF